MGPGLQTLAVMSATATLVDNMSVYLTNAIDMPHVISGMVKEAASVKMASKVMDLIV